MRTTLNIDEDLLAELKRRAGKRKLPLRKLVNATLRAGLQAPVNKQPKPRTVQPVFAMGQPTGLNLDKALALSDGLADAEITRKLNLRK